MGWRDWKEEKLLLADKYISSLAKGLHPITKAILPEDSVINDVKIVRCLYFVSEAIKEAMNCDKKKAERKKPFSISQNEISRFKISNGEITISAIVRKLNELKNDENMVKLTSKPITQWLLNCDFLQEVEENGKTVKRPTESGKSMGMSVRRMITDYGFFNAVVYNSKAQQFILDNLWSILNFDKAINKEKYKSDIKSQNSKSTNAGQPWSYDEERNLIDMYNKKYTIAEMSEALERSKGGIRSRLKKLGLIDR